MRILKGKWHEPFEGEKQNPGFYISYDVVADNQDEALSFIKEFEPDAVRKSLMIKKIEIFEANPQPKGIYKTAGYSFFADK
jgi:hypothetical protein